MEVQAGLWFSTGAIPLATSASFWGGAGTIGFFGLSGISDVYGSIFGYNPMLDTVFRGNEKLYNNSKFLSAMGTAGITVVGAQNQHLISDGNAENKPTQSQTVGNGVVKDGLGKVSGKEITVTEKGINQVKDYLTQQGFIDDYENAAMVGRLENALVTGTKITGADAVYYLHELKEAQLVSTGIPQNIAHDMTIQYYEVSPYSVYHPDVIKMEPGWWNDAWFEFWGIEK